MVAADRAAVEVAVEEGREAVEAKGSVAVRAMAVEGMEVAADAERVAAVAMALAMALRAVLSAGGAGGGMDGHLGQPRVFSINMPRWQQCND